MSCSCNLFSEKNDMVTDFIVQLRFVIFISGQMLFDFDATNFQKLFYFEKCHYLSLFLGDFSQNF